MWSSPTAQTRRRHRLSSRPRRWIFNPKMHKQLLSQMSSQKLLMNLVRLLSLTLANLVMLPSQVMTHKIHLLHPRTLCWQSAGVHIPSTDALKHKLSPTVPTARVQTRG